MKNELSEAWDKRVEDDNTTIKEIADKFYGGETDSPSEERVKQSLQERARIHGCCLAASWRYDYSVLIGELMKHTGLSLQEALLFEVLVELKKTNQGK